MVGIICPPPIGIRLTNLPKYGGAKSLYVPAVLIEGSDFGSSSRFDSKIQTEADYFEKIDEFIILTSAQWFKGQGVWGSKILVFFRITEISTKVFKVKF